MRKQVFPAGVFDLIVYWVVRSLFAVVGSLPPPIAFSVCEWVALLVYYLDAKHRRIGMTNLRIAFPESSDAWRREVLRKSFRQLGDLAVEVSGLGRIGSDEIRRRVRYEPGFGLEHYQEARKTGGVIFITAHLGSWELLPIAHAVLGNPLNFVVRPIDNRWLDHWATDLRSRFGNGVIPKYGSMRQLLKKLRQGEDIGILIDQNVQQKDGAFVPLFGKMACTTTSAALLALKTGSGVVAGFLRPDAKRGHYRIRFYPPIYVLPSGDKEHDLLEATARFNRRLEETIRLHPHSWLWGHRRFNTQPDGCSPYGKSRHD